MSAAIIRFARALALAPLAFGGAAHAGPSARGAFHAAPFRGAAPGRPGLADRFSRRLPPIAGVIHERGGMRPWTSGYGHTATASPLGFAHPYGSAYGHVGTASIRRPFGAGAGYRGFTPRGAFAYGMGRRLRGRGYGGYAGFGGGFAYGGAAGFYGDGLYGGAGIDGGPQGYGGAGASEAGHTATQSVYGPGPGNSYLSEEPLAVRFAEPPLAPSPYAPYSPGDRYAYAASEDVGPGPRVISLRRVGPGCGCAPGRRGTPVFYRYGVGTAY